MVIEAENIKPVRIEEEMRSSYLDYAMSVIVARALQMLETDSNRCKDEYSMLWTSLA